MNKEEVAREKLKLLRRNMKQVSNICTLAAI